MLLFLASVEDFVVAVLSSWSSRDGIISIAATIIEPMILSPAMITGFDGFFTNIGIKVLILK
jgi:hypothetical protein